MMKKFFSFIGVLDNAIEDAVSCFDKLMLLLFSFAMIIGGVYFLIILYMALKPPLLLTLLVTIYALYKAR